MNTLYKGYIKTKGKKAIEAFKDRTKYRTYDEVKNLEGFGGGLADDTILIDIDDAEQSEILMSIVEEYQLDCRVYCTSRGRHFLFKNHSITRNRTHVPLAVGLTADIKLGTRSSYEIIKIDGEERFIEWDIEEGGAYQEVPKWLFPVRTAVAVQLKRGLGKEYISQTEDLSSLRGKIDIAESIKTQSMLRKKLICTYDDFSVNSTMNRIIKSTVELLLKADIAKSRKKELRKLMVFFADVTPIDLYSVNWNLQYNRNNQSYQMLISICYLVVKGLLQTNTDGTTKLMDFLDEQRMCRLYEKFILEYYKKHYPKLTVSASHIPWALDDGIGDMLPVMQSDIHFQKENTVLIIDAKYYTNTTQVQFDKHTLHSNNLYQRRTRFPECCCMQERTL